MTPTDLLSLKIQCVSGCSSRPALYWRLFYKRGPSWKDWEVVGNITFLTTSNIGSNNIAFKANVLQPGVQYVIQVTVDRSTTSSGEDALSEYRFMTNVPPYGGKCVISVTKGYVYDTLFPFRCSGWLTDNPPLLYTLIYKDIYSDLDAILCYNAQEGEADVRMPIGDPERNFTLDVTIVITDTIGSRTLVNTRVQVRGCCCKLNTTN